MWQITITRDDDLKNIPNGYRIYKMMRKGYKNKKDVLEKTIEALDEAYSKGTFELKDLLWKSRKITQNRAVSIHTLIPLIVGIVGFYLTKLIDTILTTETAIRDETAKIANTPMAKELLDFVSSGFAIFLIAGCILIYVILLIRTVKRIISPYTTTVEPFEQELINRYIGIKMTKLKLSKSKHGNRIHLKSRRSRLYYKD